MLGLSLNALCAVDSEICCSGTPYSNLSAVAARLKAGLPHAWIYTNECSDERTDKYADECSDERTDERTDVCADKGTDECADNYTNDRTDTNDRTHTNDRTLLMVDDYHVLYRAGATRLLQPLTRVTPGNPRP